MHGTVSNHPVEVAMRRTTSTFALLLSLALLGAPVAQGCRSGGAFDVNNPEPDVAYLVVKNDNVLDMDIYAVSSGLPTRIGTVTGLSTARFALQPTLYGATDFRIIATPIGGNGRASSGQLIVQRGQTIDFTIGSNLRQSFASVR
jgi:hypothetical protein